VGFDPFDCTKEFVTLSNKTGERDTKGFHDFDPDLISKTCTKIVVGNKKSAANKIGDKSVAPATFIPAATKCPSAAATAPPSSAPAPKAPPSGSAPAPAPSPKGTGESKKEGEGLP